MADARIEHDWEQTAEVLAMIYNANRGRAPSKKPVDFDQAKRRRRARAAAARPKAGVECLAVLHGK